jgi:hypothetical protein
MAGVEEVKGMTEMEDMTGVERVMTETEDDIKKEKRATRQHRSLKLNLDCLTEAAR